MTDLLQIRLLSTWAKIPTKASEGAVGFDLYAAMEIQIHPGTRELIMTDIAVEFPVGTYGRIAPRSGLAYHYELDVAAGVVDPDFRGNIGVVMVNNSPVTYPIKVHDKIAQLVCEKVSFPEIQIVEELTPTARGGKGFGSTGST
jgi:dUTP pyrophosphatase